MTKLVGECVSTKRRALLIARHGVHAAQDRGGGDAVRYRCVTGGKHPPLEPQQQGASIKYLYPLKLSFNLMIGN